MYRPESEHAKLAKQSLETYIVTGKKLPTPDRIGEGLLINRAGVFVSLKKFGELRGCIGTTSPTRDNIAEEIIANAISAGIADPRFQKVTAEELPDIVYSVDILGRAESVSVMSELNAFEYGVIVTCGARRGLLLPNLEGIDSVGEQIAIALCKAGIFPNESYSLERFKVERFI